MNRFTVYSLFQIKEHEHFNQRHYYNAFKLEKQKKQLYKVGMRYDQCF